MSRKKPRVTGVGNRSLIASLVTLALGLAPAASQAAGLGRLNVLSTIGQPLLGEIELVSVSKEELSSLTARVAPAESFQSANVQFNPALVGARLTVERRPDGRPYLRLSSQRSVEEPFIDLLIELTWSTGRLVREYTALIDPPGAAPPAAAAAPVVATPVAPSAPGTGAAVPAPAARPQAQATEPGQKTYGPVQSGDTLRKIAAGVRPQGVSLEQVLVGIFRSNPDAFINNNMNLLRTGKILRIPEPGELGQVTTADAGNEVRTQAADWNAYRQRVASAAPAAAPGESRAAAGKITARVDEPAAAKDAPKEVLKISKGEPGKEMPVDKALQDRVRVLEEEVTAREKSLKDSGERIVSLEKTIKDMQRLLELKGVPAPSPADKADAAKAPADSPKADVKPGVAESKPAPTPPVAATPPVATVKPTPKPMTPEPAPRAAEWWEDPTVLGGGLLGLGALAGAGYLLARRRREPAEAATEPVIRRVPSVAGPAAVAAGAAAAIGTSTQPLPAHHVPTTPVPSDDVDPIAEADVYVAYGRDAQAEEILKEALIKNPGRQEVKLKLLEIYAARKSKPDFNVLASELHTSTGGQGDVWMRAAAMGFALDPDNALYAAGKDSANLAPIGVQTDVNLDFDLDMVSAAGSPSTVTDLPLESGQAAGHEVKTTILAPETMSQLRAEGAAQAAAQGTATETDIPAPASTDINLGVPPVTSTTSNVIDFEFDPTKTANLEAPSTATFDPDRTMVISPENQEKAQNLDIEIDLSSLDAKGPAETTKEPPASPAPSDISFDFNIPAVEAPPTVSGVVPPTDIKLDVPEFKPADTATMDFALDTVSFDLGSMQSRETPAAPVHDEHWYDVQTKFDLAKAYQEMGDKEGAREILAEVIKDGDAQQQAEAKSLLETLE